MYRTVHNFSKEKSMLAELNGSQMKLVCPNCQGDGIGESGLGEKFVHCFGRCMADISREECQVAPISSPEELQLLSQPPY